MLNRCFHVFCAATQIIETFGSLRSFFHLPLPLYLLSIPFVILFQAKSCIHYLRFRTTFHSNNKLNDKRFRNITLPANVIANITRLGKLHYSDLYNLRLSSKKLSYVFFGDDVGASLRALRGVPCGQDERLKCYNCKLPGCHVSTVQSLLKLPSYRIESFDTNCPGSIAYSAQECGLESPTT